MPIHPSIAHYLIERRDNYLLDQEDILNTIMVDPAAMLDFLRFMKLDSSEEINLVNIRNSVFRLNPEDLVDLFDNSSIEKTNRQNSINEKFLSALWHHSITTALLAKSLNYRKRTRTSSKLPHLDLYIAGLLHNIGWLIINHLFPDELNTMLVKAEIQDEWDENLEVNCLGMDHTETGALFLEHSSLPPDYCQVVRDHHNPGFSGKLGYYSALIEISAAICPYQVPMEKSLEMVSPYFPNQLVNEEPSRAVLEMKHRYSQHLTQAKTIADKMLTRYFY